MSDEAPDNTGLLPLTNDASRRELFARIAAAAEQENPPSPDEIEPYALPGGFSFPHDTEFDGNGPRADSIFGIDISHYTGTGIIFDSLKQQNVRFVYAKASQGISYVDKLFGHYWRAMGSLPPDKRVLRGAYHFLSASLDGRSQANTFLRVLDDSGGLGNSDMPPVVDLEWDVIPGRPGSDRWKGVIPDEIVATALDWLRTVEAKTYMVPMIYTARAFWTDRGIPETKIDEFSHYKIWIADYSRSARAREVPAQIGGRKEDLWQFTEKARLSAGYGQALDATIYKGSEASFLALFQPPQTS